MTTTLQPGRLGGRAGDPGSRSAGFPDGRTPGLPGPPGLSAPPGLPGPGGGVPGPARRPGRPRPRADGRWLTRHPAWPLIALFAGYPLWWALGFGDYIFILLAIPMVARMYGWRAHGRRPVRTPPGFGLWLLFLLCMVAGAAALTLTAPGTIATPVGTRMLSFGVRAASYLGVTALLLFAGNLTERELPRQRIAWLLGLFGIYAIVGGLGGVLAPHFSFSSPLLLMLPHSIQANPYIQAEMHPGLAQVQNVLGVAEGRPDAPFPYTNTWGNCIALLVPWLITAWWIRGRRRQRLIAAAALTLVVVPIVYSLDRGLWLALIFAGAYLSLRLAARGRLALLGVICVGVAVAGTIIITTPLQSLVSQRLVHGKSDAHRASLSILATHDGLASPVIGYGDTRHQQGSVTSIAVGKTAKCRQCGQVSVGNNGQLWLLLICSGFAGAALYLAFFAYGTWRFWRDTSPEGTAGVLVLLLTFVFMIAYDAVGAPLGITMLVYALLWRNEQARREAPAGPVRLASPGLRRGRYRPRGPGRRGTRRLSQPAGKHMRALPVAAADGAAAAAAPQAAAPQAATPPAPAQASTDQLGVAQPTAAHPAPALPTARAAGGRLAEVARGSTLNLAGAAFSGAASVALTVLVTRNFSKPVAGAFFTAISLFLIAETAATLGGYVGLVNFIAGLRSLGREARISAIIRAAVVPVVVVSVAGAAALVLAAGPLARIVLSGHLGDTGGSPAAVTTALRWLAVTIPFAAVLDTLLGASRGYRDMRPTVVIDRLGRSGLQLLGVLAAAVMGGASLLAPLWAVPYVPTAVLAWLWLRRVRRRRQGLTRVGSPGDNGAQPRPAVPTSSARPVPAAWVGVTSKQLARPGAWGFWRFTAPRAVAALAQIVIQRLDIVLVAIMRGPAEAAVYTAATRFLVAGQLANAAITMAAQPRYAELFAVGDRPGVNSVYQATTAWLMLLTWPMYLLAMIFGPEVLTVFGHSYRTGGTVMVVLGAAMLLATTCGQVDTVLISSGRSSWSLMNGLLAVAVNVGLDLALIPRYGIIGAAIGWAAAITLTNVLPLAQLAAVSRVHPFGRSSLAAALLPAVCLGAVPLTVRAVAGPGAVAAAVGIVLGGGLLAAASWRFRETLNLPPLPGTRVLRRSLGKLLAYRAASQVPVGADPP